MGHHLLPEEVVLIDYVEREKKWAEMRGKIRIDARGKDVMSLYFFAPRAGADWVDLG